MRIALPLFWRREQKLNSTLEAYLVLTVTENTRRCAPGIVNHD